MKKKKVVVFEEKMPKERTSAKNGFNGYESEDGDSFRYFRFYNPGNALYVDLRSSNEESDDSIAPEERDHKVWDSLLGKKVRITVEVME